MCIVVRVCFIHIALFVIFTLGSVPMPMMHNRCCAVSGRNVVHRAVFAVAFLSQTVSTVTVALSTDPCGVLTTAAVRFAVHALEHA